MIVTRAEHETELKRLLIEALPATVQIDSMPLGLDEALVYDIRDGGAVWLVYAGGKPDAGQGDLDGEHREGWVWSCLCMGKKYRSSQERAASSLDLLEMVDAALSGAEIEYREVVRLGDQILPTPKGKGVTCYEAQFRVEVFRDRK